MSLVQAGAEPVKHPEACDHLLLAYPSVAVALAVAQARSGRRGSLWVLVEPTPEGAAAAAVTRAAAVEGSQRVHGVMAPMWPEAEAIRAWMHCQPRHDEGLGRLARRLELLELVVAGPDVTIRGGRSPMGQALSGGTGPIARILDAPDRALAACTAQHLDLAPVRDALASGDPLVVGTDHLTQRPGSLPSAVLSAAASVSLAEGGAPWLQVGPVGPGPRILGIAGLEAEDVRRQLLGGAGEVWLDVDWPDALPAFPHLADVAGHLVDHPVLRRGKAVRLVCTQAEAVLGCVVPRDRPLAELGLDSLGSEELRQRLVEQHGVPLPLTLVLEHPTAEAIGTFLAQLSKGPM